MNRETKRRKVIERSLTDNNYAKSLLQKSGILTDQDEVSNIYSSDETDGKCSIKELEHEIERQMDDLWGRLPDANIIEARELTEEEAYTLGRYTALENILNLIDDKTIILLNKMLQSIMLIQIFFSCQR